MQQEKSAGDKIVSNLGETVQQLREDVERVEIWAGALRSFAQPIPDYEHDLRRYELHGQSK